MSWCGISWNRNRYLATLQKHFQYFAHVTIFPVMPSKPGFVCTAVGRSSQDTGGVQFASDWQECRGPEMVTGGYLYLF